MFIYVVYNIELDAAICETGAFDWKISLKSKWNKNSLKSRTWVEEPVLQIPIRDCEIITAHNVGGACAHCIHICLAFNGDHFFFENKKNKSITDLFANSHTMKMPFFCLLLNKKNYCTFVHFLSSFFPSKRFSFRLFSFQRKKKNTIQYFIFFHSKSWHLLKDTESTIV